MSKRVQFYGNEKSTGNRRIFSFKVENKNDAIRALQRFDVPAGWYLPDSNKKISERIENKSWVKNKPLSIWDRLDKMMDL